MFNIFKIKTQSEGNKIPNPAFLAAFITLLVYIPALQNGFVWDDELYIYRNPYIRNLNMNLLKLAFTTAFAANWHPLTVISYAMDYMILGYNPFIYHLTNVTFHVLNTILVSTLTVRLMKIMALKFEGSADSSPDASGISCFTAGLSAALLFGLHPLHVESVAWASERKDVLSTFFFLLSVLMYLKYSSRLNSDKAFHYASALIFFALGLMSKPMVISLPIVLLILDFYPLGRLADLRRMFRGSKQVVLEKIPFFALSALSAMLTIWAQRRGGAMVSTEAVPVMVRVLVGIRAYMFYLYKTALPVKLTPFYPYPREMTVFLSYEYIISLTLFLTITFLCILLFKRYRFLPAIWLYYIITLFPAIGIVQVGNQAAADRYMYLPSLGLFIPAGILTGRFLEKTNRGTSKGAGFAASSKRRLLAFAIASIAVISLVLSYLTVRQEALWKDPITLWNYEIQEFPQAYWPYFIRGKVYQDINDYTHAIEDYGTSIMLNPKDSHAYNNRGVVYGNLGRFEEAIRDFSMAIKVSPDFADAYSNRGVAYFKAGDHGRALADLKKAVELNPNHAGAYYNLGQVYSSLGDAAQAELNFRKAAILKGN